MGAWRNRAAGGNPTRRRRAAYKAEDGVDGTRGASQSLNGNTSGRVRLYWNQRTKVAAAWLDCDDCDDCADATLEAEGNDCQPPAASRSKAATPGCARVSCGSAPTLGRRSWPSWPVTLAELRAKASGANICCQRQQCWNRVHMGWIKHLSFGFVLQATSMKPQNSPTTIRNTGRLVGCHPRLRPLSKGSTSFQLFPSSWRGFIASPVFRLVLSMHSVALTASREYKLHRFW